MNLKRLVHGFMFNQFKKTLFIQKLKMKLKLENEITGGNEIEIVLI